MLVKTGFILLTLLMATLAVYGLSASLQKASTDATTRRRLVLLTIGVLSVWFSYIAILSFSKVLIAPGLPPRIPLLLVLPCFLFMIWFFRSGHSKKLIAATPRSWLIYPQFFRVGVELLLWQLALKGLVPIAATFEGYNYEIIVALSSPVVALIIRRQPSQRLPVILWNCAGLCTLAIVVFTIISHAYFPSIYTNPQPLSMNDFGMFPYTLLPGFLMPFAVFLHVFSLVKLRRERRRV